jgi:DNA-binding transcriptional LysR family regulator
MNYTLHQLNVFLKVVEFESVTKAAIALHMTQPAVSIQLKNFQDQFDIPLTEIVGRRLHVTEFGREICFMAERILNEVHAINYRTLAYKGLLAGKLRIASVSTGKYVLPYYLTGFIKKFEGVDLQVDVTNRRSVLSSLEANEVDFALVSIMPEHIKVEGISLLENRLFLLGNQNIPANEGTQELFKNHTYIYREEGSATRQSMERWLEKQGHKPIRKLELTSNEAVKQAVIAGLGISLMPLIGLKKELSDGDLRIIDVPGLPVRSHWQIIWLETRKMSPVAVAFVKYLQEEKENIYNEHFMWTANEPALK